MIDIDFLPADYVCVQITRKNDTWLRGLFVAVLALMLVGWVAQQNSIRDLTAHRNRLNEQAAQVLAQLDSGVELQAELTRAENSERLLNGLRHQVPPTRWLIAVVGALPEQVAITEIHSEIDDGTDLPVRQDPRTTNPPSAEPPVDPVQQDLRRLLPIAARRTLMISVRGTAADDLEVSSFLTTLRETKLFERVQLLFTDQLPTGDKTMRSFAIRLRTRSLNGLQSPSTSTAPVASGTQKSYQQ